MGFLRRILGRDQAETRDAPEAAGTSPADQAELDAEERARDLELLREEQARMTELTRRQLRYAPYAWQPPDEGGERRSGDEDDPSEIA